MCLREAELSRSPRAARTAAKQKKPKPKKKVRVPSVGIVRDMHPSFAPLLDDRCLTFREWCQLNGIGARTGWRILHGQRPPSPN